MTSHPRDISVPTPPAPEELAATDALLDRLAARTPDEADLRDPVTAVLAELAAEVDLPTIIVRSEETVRSQEAMRSVETVRSDTQTAGDDIAAHDPRLSRLLGVLGDRPLFLMDDAERTDARQDAELGSPPEIIVLDDPSWHGPSDVVIDLRDPASQSAADDADADDDARDEDATDDRVDAAGDEGAPTTLPVPVLAPVPDATPDPTLDPVGPPVPPAQRRPGGGRIIPMPVGRWTEGHSVNAETLRRAARHVPLSIAATIAVFTVASGVTAAITGDPLAPISGVTRVVDRISGNDDAMLVAVQRDINQAQEETTEGNLPAAEHLLRHATSNLDQVPAGQKSQLAREIGKVQASVAAARAATPTTPPPPSVLPPVPTITPSPTLTPTPTPTDEPSATVTPTDPAPEPTTEPSVPAPTTAPPVVKPTVTKSVPVKPTPARTAP